jgi:phytoene/squalene synthetase
LEKYTVASICTSQSITKNYSTSFYTASLFYPKEIRDGIFSIYGFVRIADEIVDTFLNYDQVELMENFEIELKNSFKHKISTNPILNSFQHTVDKYNISHDYIDAFLSSMKDDLKISNYSTKEELDKYIYGSASVVGLMCLSIFCNGNKEEIEQLTPQAKKLGEAFQKVNFLRDLNEDTNNLNRIYFYQLKDKEFNEETKIEIIEDIEKDFKIALDGIKKLPKNSKIAVVIAYFYYLKLLKKIKKTPAKNILIKRYRISNFRKSMLIIKALIYTKLGLI